MRLGVVLVWLATVGASGQTYRILHSFDDSDGRGPNGELVLSGGVLYGTTSLGSGGGKVFRMNVDGSGFLVLKTFDGQILAAGLTLDGQTLYGVTYGNGGDQNPGFIFRLSTTGTDFRVLRQFQGVDGGYSQARLVLLGSTLYGTTTSGGGNGIGTVFRVNTDGSDFSTMHHFNGGADGSYPWAGLALSQGMLYGTTAWGGGVFKIGTDGSGFSVIATLADNGPANPDCGVTLSGATLYGTTYYGGAGAGTVFKVNTDGSDLEVLKRFSPSNQPYGGVVVSDGKIYGTTMGTFSGGDAISGYGSVFKVETNGNGYEVLKSFNGEDGANPQATLLLAGRTLYGTTKNGGSANRGVAFSLVLNEPPIITSPPPTQTAELGSTVCFDVRATGTLPIRGQWYYSETNVVGSFTTNEFLRLTNIQYSQSGAYTVVLTNAAGAVTSAPAWLSVIAPVERRFVPGIIANAAPGSTVSLEHCETMAASASWGQLGSLVMTHSPELYFDLTEPLPAKRFYRARAISAPRVPPVLKAQMIPAITLVGTTGSVLRVDGIDAIGPTDAWFPLATLTLTNTTQLFFDITAPGQPARLYRLVPIPPP